MSYVQPHIPFSTPAKYLAMVNEERIPAAVGAEWKIDPAAPEYFGRQADRYAENDTAYCRLCYFADLIHLDEQLGRLVARLGELGRYDSTYIFFLSDHGELLGDHSHYGKEEVHYDACIRVPLIIAGPGLRQGATCKAMVQHEDICPAILDLAGTRFDEPPNVPANLTIPKDRKHAFYGRSLAGYLRDGEDFVRDTAYSESYNRIWSVEYRDWVRTLRTRRYRYTYYCGSRDQQLFDMIEDPDEQRSLAADPAYSNMLRDFRDELLEFVIRQDCPLPPRELYSFGTH